MGLEVTNNGPVIISPAEAYRGYKINHDRELRVGFGEYCEVVDRYSDNTMRPRTEPAISLYPTGNVNGTVVFFNLLTRRTIRRDQFTVLPMSSLVISSLNQLSTEKGVVPISLEPLRLSTDDTTSYLDQTIPVSNTLSDNVSC